MFSEKDFERLWFLYKTEGEPNGVSINSFCIGNNIPYTAFYDWFVEGKVARVAGQQRVVIELPGVCLVATAYIPTAFIKPIPSVSEK